LPGFEHLEAFLSTGFVEERDCMPIAASETTDTWVESPCAQVHLRGEAELRQALTAKRLQEMAMRAEKVLQSVRFAALCGAAVIAMGVTACGSSSDDEPDAAGNGASTSTTASTAKGTPLTVVALLDSSGPNNGHQGDASDVLKAWVADSNAHGGIAGHRVTLRVEDTQGNPSKAAAAAQKIAGDKSVVGTVVVDGSAETASVPALSKAGVPVIGGVGYSPLWGTSRGNKILKQKALPNVFLINTSTPASLGSFISAAQKLALKKIVGVSFSQVPASKLGIDLTCSLAKIVQTPCSGITIDASAPNFTAQCLQIVKGKADFVILTMPDALSARFIGDCRTQGYDGFFGATGGAVTPGLYTKVGDAKLAGGLWAFPWFADAAPVKRFRDVMAASNVADEKWQGGSGPVVWTTMELFKKALEDNRGKLDDTVTRGNVIAAYHTIQDERLGGLLPGPVTYKPGAVAPPACYWLYSYEGGKFSGSYDPTCPDPRLGAS